MSVWNLQKKIGYSLYYKNTVVDIHGEVSKIPASDWQHLAMPSVDSGIAEAFKSLRANGLGLTFQLARHIDPTTAETDSYHSLTVFEPSPDHGKPPVQVVRLRSAGVADVFAKLQQATRTDPPSPSAK